MQATFTKLKDGRWGLRVVFSPPEFIAGGSTVTAVRRDGTSECQTIGTVVWIGDDRDQPGRKVALATIAARPRPVRAYRPGQDCPGCHSEPLDEKLHCWECGFTG